MSLQENSLYLADSVKCLTDKSSTPLSAPLQEGIRVFEGGVCDFLSSQWQRADVNPTEAKQDLELHPPVFCFLSNIADITSCPSTSTWEEAIRTIVSCDLPPRLHSPFLFPKPESKGGEWGRLFPSSLRPGGPPFYSAHRVYVLKGKLCYLEIPFFKKPGFYAHCLTKKRSRKSALSDEQTLCSGQHLSVLSFLGQ